MKNFGQTPATAVSYWVGIIPHKFPLEISLAKSSSSAGRRVGVIAPDHTFEALVKIPIMDNGNQIEIPSTAHALYVYGEFHYTDAFNRRQVSPYRYMRRGGKDWAHDGQLEMCEDGNDPT